MKVLTTVPDQQDGRTRLPARRAMPTEITPTYTEVPDALMRHFGDLDLTFADVGFIVALHSYRWYADSRVNPAMDTLAGDAGASKDTVRRHVRRLESLGLLRVERHPATSRVEHYDLTPLWDALAEIVRAGDGGTSATQGVADLHEGGRTSAKEGVADLPPEVDEEETDELKQHLQHNARPREGEDFDYSARLAEIERIERAAGEDGLAGWERRRLLDHADRQREEIQLRFEQTRDEARRWVDESVDEFIAFLDEHDLFDADDVDEGSRRGKLES